MRFNHGRLSLLIILSTILAMSEPASSWPSVTDHFILPPGGQKANAFHMVVIGDSIAWGNGLNTEEKYYYLVAEWLQKTLNKPIDVTVYAHSGATISGGAGESVDPNLNSGYPTLKDQANNILNADDVDLILVSGGINDVGVMTILNVYAPAEEIDQRAQSIKDPMKNLLSHLLSNCRNAKIIVTNYYPIVSEDSDITGIAAAYGAGVFIINDVLNKNILDAFTIKERLTENSNMFFGGAITALSNAALESDSGANRIAFAYVNFKPANCYAASETWLWKLVGLKTDDDQFEYRSQLSGDIINKINAIGHPNRDGAIEYARAIESAIKSKGQDWLQKSPTIQTSDKADIEQKAKTNINNELDKLKISIDSYKSLLASLGGSSGQSATPDFEFSYQITGAKFCTNKAEASSYMASMGFQDIEQQLPLSVIDTLGLERSGFCIVVIDYTYTGFGTVTTMKYPIVCNELGEPYWQSWQLYGMLNQLIGGSL